MNCGDPPFDIRISIQVVLYIRKACIKRWYRCVERRLSWCLKIYEWTCRSKKFFFKSTINFCSLFQKHKLTTLNRSVSINNNLSATHLSKYISIKLIVDSMRISRSKNITSSLARFTKIYFKYTNENFSSSLVFIANKHPIRISNNSSTLEREKEIILYEIIRIYACL